MVNQQLRGRGIRQTELLNAMETVPRHLFVPERVRPEAYVDEAVPLGPDGDSLLQPYMTALMIELLKLDGSQKVLEVGTGTGYDAAVLSKLAREVYTIEISPSAARKRARGSSRSGSPTSRSASATAIRAGPIRRRSTPSS